jgi:hypothetical protein
MGIEFFCRMQSRDNEKTEAIYNRKTTITLMDDEEMWR